MATKQLQTQKNTKSLLLVGFLFFLFISGFFALPALALDVTGPLDYKIIGMITDTITTVQNSQYKAQFRTTPAIPKDSYALQMDFLYGLSPQDRCDDASGLWLPGATSNPCCGDDDSFDKGYVSLDSRYFCGKDLYDDKISFKSEAEWNWWDASAPGSPFRIHSQLDVDYISNGAEWFYCDATGDVLPRGSPIVIAEGDSFTSATHTNQYSCIDALNSIFDVFDFADNPTLFELCDGETRFCCKKTDSHDTLPGYSPQTGFLNSMECKTNCYIETDMSLSDFLSTTENYNLLNNSYCEAHPSDFNCGGSSDLFSGQLNSQEIEKAHCGYNLAGCLDETADLSQACNNINLTLDLNNNGHYEEFVGVLCGESQYQYCASNQYLLSRDVQTSQQTSPPSKVCCLSPNDNTAIKHQCKNVDENITEQQCRSIGGDYLPEMQQSQYTCTPTNVVVGDCCLGGRWIPKWNFPGSDIAFAQPEAFICYKQSGKNLVAECCNDFSTCFNTEDNSLFSSSTENMYLHGYYGTGGALHTLLNFDKIFDGYLRDYVLVERDIDSNNNLTISFYDSGLFPRQLFDWNSFDYLEFDVAFNLDKLEKIILYDNSPIKDANRCESKKFLSDYLVNGKGIMRWHHVVVPLTEFECDSGFNWETVYFLDFVTSYDGGNLQVALDSFFLSEDDTKENTDNYYCTGNFGQWITNLDGPTDEGFAEDATFTQIGPHWYACEAQASFDWTGSRCCGDDTRTFAGGGEYYVDTRGACFSGKTVYSDMTVAHALNANHFKDVLYYIDSEGDKGFYVCNYDESSSDYGNYYISYNETPTNDPLFHLNELFIKDDFEIVGTHVCMPSKEWVNVDSLSKSRIIAAKMFDIATEEIDETDPHFTIHCDGLASVQPLDLSSGDGGLALTNVDSSIRDSCVLSYADSADLIEENILIGLGLQQTTIRGFLEGLYQHVGAFDESLAYLEDDEDLLNQEREAFVSACDGIIAGDARDDFFVVCDYDGEYGLRMAYNPEFNILFLAYTVDDGQYGGIFSQGGSILSFVQDFFTNLLNWFGSWFTSSDSETTFSAEALLPIFNDDMISFDNFYLHVKGEKQLLGLAEQRANTGAANTDTDDDWYVTIEYVGINSSVEFLADKYYTTHPLALNYMYGNETNDAGEFTTTQKQILALINPHQSVHKLDYEPTFDWRRLMSGLVLDTSVSFNPEPPLYETIHGDGIIQLGEECDYVYRCTSNDFEAESTSTSCVTLTSENACEAEIGCAWTQDIIFKFNQNSCEFWNTNFEPEDTVSCYLNNYTLNYSACSLKSCEERRLYTRSYEQYQIAPTADLRSYDPAQLATVQTSSEPICCNTPTDCVYGNSCYASGTLTAFSSDKQFQCQAGIWKLSAPADVSNNYQFDELFALANQKGCDVYENHSFCTQSQLCVITPTICDCDSSCETRNVDGVCVSNCPTGEQCWNGNCCANSCILDNPNDLERCANGCTPEPKEYCWNVCELENEYCGGNEMDYPDNDPYNPDGYDEGGTTTTSSEPSYCTTTQYMVTPDLDCTFVSNYDCTETQCNNNFNGCAWQIQTLQDILDSDSSSGGSSGGGVQEDLTMQTAQLKT